LERRLYVSTDPETFEELRGEINQAHKSNDKLKKELASSENRGKLLEKAIEENAKHYKDRASDYVS
jgi:predicted  nucleic acid-binding Zn-ribbon protein